MTINLLAQPYAQLHDAALMGDQFDVLAALRELAKACPEIVEWLSRETGETMVAVQHALACGRGAVPCGDLSGNMMRIYDRGAIDGCRDVAQALADPEPVALDDLIDDARMFGTLDEVLDELRLDDDMAARTISIHYGLEDGDPLPFREVGARLERSGEMCRRYAKRGIQQLRARMEARGRT